MLASDPDGDRLAVAVPDPAAIGGWRKLTGDQVGGLLGAFVLGAFAADAAPDRATPGQAAPDRAAPDQAAPGLQLAATTVVSSSLLSGIADSAGGPLRGDPYWLQVDRPGRGSPAWDAVRIRIRRSPRVRGRRRGAG